MKTEIQIKIYSTDNEKSPYNDWFDSMEFKIQAIVIKRLARVRLGNFGDHKFLRNGVWELIFDVGPGFRIYFGKIGTTIVLLLNAGNKSSQARNINKAIQYLDEYKENKK